MQMAIHFSQLEEQIEAVLIFKPLKVNGGWFTARSWPVKIHLHQQSWIRSKDSVVLTTQLEMVTKI